MPESHFSPTAIPPRTSSNPHSPRQSRNSNTMRPLAEADWLAQRQQQDQPASPKHSSPSHLPQTSITGPAPDLTKYQKDEIGTQAGKTWSADKEEILLGPYDYLLTHPGKDIRAQAIAAFNQILRVPSTSLAIITKVVGMLHTASLLVDDVEDSSQLRRGVPVAHSIFGTAQTINSANYVYFAALQELFALRRRDEAIRIYTEELLNLHRGQGMDLFWRDTLTCPTEEDYLEMVGNKTGGLFRLAVKLMQAESESTIDCVPLVNLIGTIYQINDDYLNLCSTNYTSLKGVCEDLTEGKFSFPIIHAIRAHPENLQLLNILKQHTTDDEVKKYAVAYMERVGSFTYCRDVLATLLGRARAMVGAMQTPETAEAWSGIRKILDMLGV